MGRSGEGVFCELPLGGSPARYGIRSSEPPLKLETLHTDGVSFLPLRVFNPICGDACQSNADRVKAIGLKLGILFSGEKLNI